MAEKHEKKSVKEAAHDAKFVKNDLQRHQKCDIICEENPLQISIFAYDITDLSQNGICTISSDG